MGIFGETGEIGPDTMIQRKQDILFNELDGEVVMISVEKSEYYGIDKVGTRIWELLKTKISFRDLIRQLLLEYNVSQIKCEKDTFEFINKLMEKDLVSIY